MRPAGLASGERQQGCRSPWRFALLSLFLSLVLAPALRAADPPAPRLAEDALDASTLASPTGDPAPGWAGPWQLSQLRPPLAAEDRAGLLLRGTGDRNNPLRRELAAPYRGPELFVRFRFLYEPPEDEGEFFVLWLDRLDGGDRATHGSDVPNLGVHVAERGPQQGKTVFMVRIGQGRTAFSEVELERDREYLLQARCFECHSGEIPESGLRLDVRRELLGYSSGEAVAEPGLAARSRLIEKVPASDPARRMPPAGSGKAPLDEREIGLLYA